MNKPKPDNRLSDIIRIYGSDYIVRSDHTYNANNQPVIEISDLDGCPAGVLSICIPTHPFASNETAISCDLPQDVVIEGLERIGLAKRTGRIALSGHGEYPIVKMMK